jgi:nuclear GTP-binding protein
VGIIGYPNVGKSSLINSLKRSKAAAVSSIPGFTKTLQEVQLDKKIKLIDCPGVIFSEDSKNAHLLRNCVSAEKVEDPISIVSQVLRRVKPAVLLSLYRIPKFESSEEFLDAVARKLGKLGKGGVPNRTLAARSVLQDWNSGKLPFYSEVPVSTKPVAANSIVTSWSKEFNLEEVFAAEQSAVIEGLPDVDMDDYMAIEAGEFETSEREDAQAAKMLELGSDEEMEYDDDEVTLILLFVILERH